MTSTSAGDENLVRYANNGTVAIRRPAFISSPPPPSCKLPAALCSRVAAGTCLWSKAQGILCRSRPTIWTRPSRRFRSRPTIWTRPSRWCRSRPTIWTEPSRWRRSRPTIWTEPSRWCRSRPNIWTEPSRRCRSRPTIRTEPSRWWRFCELCADGEKTFGPQFSSSCCSPPDTARKHDRIHLRHTSPCFSRLPDGINRRVLAASRGAAPQCSCRRGGH